MGFALKPLMQEGWSNIKESDEFMQKIQNLKIIPDETILVTADIGVLHTIIIYEPGLKAIKEVFLTAIWLSHGQIWAILLGTVSLIRC